MAISSLVIDHEDLRLLLLAAACQSTKCNGNQRARGQRPASRFTELRVNRTGRNFRNPVSL